MIPIDKPDRTNPTTESGKPTLTGQFRNMSWTNPNRPNTQSKQTNRQNSNLQISRISIGRTHETNPDDRIRALSEIQSAKSLNGRIRNQTNPAWTNLNRTNPQSDESGTLPKQSPTAEEYIDVDVTTVSIRLTKSTRLALI